MSTLLKVLGFTLALVLLFTLVANLLPQVEGEAPAQEKVDLSSMSVSDFVALGESIFKGKGTCTLCHNDLGRAPNLLAEDVVDTAAKRLADPRYHGQAGDAESYIRESMLHPGAFVVKGFGKKGSNDSESPMPEVDKPPIQLSSDEINAVIAYLQDKDGNPVTVALPSAETASKPAPAPAKPAAAPLTAQQLLTQHSCVACHAILDSTATIGPSLQHVGTRLTAEQIRSSIVDPAAVVAKGYPPIMPPNVADSMSVKELKTLVAFLAKQK